LHPKLDGCKKGGEKLVEIAADLGLTPPPGKPSLFEPAANAYARLVR